MKFNINIETEVVRELTAYEQETLTHILQRELSHFLDPINNPETCSRVIFKSYPDEESI